MREKSANRQRNLHVRMSEPEEAAFKEAARIAGQSLSDYTRQALRKTAIGDLMAAGRQKTVAGLSK